MIARVVTVAFCDLDVRSVEVECTLAAGLPGLTIIGLADKAVSEARERVRSALPACLWRCRQSSYHQPYASRLAQRGRTFRSCNRAGDTQRDRGNSRRLPARNFSHRRFVFG